MILKTLTHDHGKADCWNYYDNIENASVYFDEPSGMVCISVHFKGSASDVIIAINDEAYLCNDKGQTIEKLFPAVKQRESSHPPCPTTVDE